MNQVMDISKGHNRKKITSKLLLIIVILISEQRVKI